jgi:hypothetical protein
VSVELYAFEMLTGQRLTPLPVSTASWTLTVNADEQVTCSIPARAKITDDLRIWETTALARTGLLVVVDDIPVAAGPIWKRRYTQGGTIELTAGGLRSYWARRILLPVAARTTPLVDPTTGDPTASLNFSASGMDYGTVAKRYIELVTAWPNGNIPLVLPADRVGTRIDTVAAVDLKTVKTLLDNLQNLERGPDIAFRPRWSANGLGIYWEMQTGTEDNPRLGNTDATLSTWTVGAPVGGAFGLTVDEDGSRLTEEVFALGGGSADKVVAARSRNPALANAGTPLLQGVDKGHNDATLQARVQSYADQGAYLGQYTSSFWSMQVRAIERGTPVLGDYWLGDLATIVVDEAEPVIPAGNYVRRISSISGDATGDSFSLTFAEALA